MKKLFAPKECYSKADDFCSGYAVGDVKLLEKTEYYKENELQSTSYLVEYLNPETENNYSPVTSYVEKVFDNFDDCKKHCDELNVQFKADCISSCVKKPEFSFGVEETTRMIDENLVIIAKENEELKAALESSNGESKQKAQ